MPGEGSRIVFRRHGGPEELSYESFDPGAPAPGEVLVRQDAIGLNFIDTYHRTGLYPAAVPFTPGAESAGQIIALGEGVTGLAVGDRVAAASGLGGYATHRAIPAARAVRLPDDIPSETAAAALLKGLTACYLAEDMMALGRGQSALVHSAAGGVGAFLVPWLRDNGVTVIAHTTSPTKAASIEADHVLSAPFADLPAIVRNLTGGEGVDVAFDGVGRDSWDASLGSLARRGRLVSYGNASGEVPPIALLDLLRAGSITVSRPGLADYIATREALDHAAARLFDRLRCCVIRPRIGQRFALKDAADAHRAIEARATVGSTLLLP